VLSTQLIVFFTVRVLIAVENTHELETLRIRELCAMTSTIQKSVQTISYYVLVAHGLARIEPEDFLLPDGCVWGVLWLAIAKLVCNFGKCFRLQVHSRQVWGMLQQADDIAWRG
jgi:hypothetical protein